MPKPWKPLVLQGFFCLQAKQPSGSTRGTYKSLEGSHSAREDTEVSAGNVPVAEREGKTEELVCQVRSQPCRESPSASAAPSGVCADPLFMGGFDSMPAVFWKRAWGGLSCLFCGKVGDGSHMVREFPLEKGMASLFSGKNTRPSSVFPV